MHDNVKHPDGGNDGKVHDDVQGLRRHVQDGIDDDVQGKRVRKAGVQHVRRHVRGMRDGVREDGRQDGDVQAVRRHVQEMRTGMQKHDKVTILFFTFLIYRNSHSIKKTKYLNSYLLSTNNQSIPLFILFNGIRIHYSSSHKNIMP
jgi:hypothetical protein